MTAAIQDETLTIHGAKLDRRGFMAAGGALIVAVGMAPGTARAAGNSLDATRPASWIEIHADSTMLIRTGKCDFGQSTIYTAYRQIVAEEMSVPVAAITTVISGDTDRTPDGGGTFSLLVHNLPNLRKAAAYTREAVLELAARRFGVARSAVSVTDGVISGGGKHATYGEIVTGQDLALTIPVTGTLTGFMGLQVAGNPPMKPVSQYTIIGKPVKNPIIRPKVSGELKWVGDVKLPGMLHARTIHPETLGSKLISAGKVDAASFPGVRVVVLGNLVAVVASDEWQAVQAAQAVAADTKWTPWKGLPGSDHLFDHLQHKVNWGEVPTSKGATKGDITSIAAKTHKGTYFLPYLKHAPIGPTVSLADVKADGSVTVHTHSQNPQSLRAEIALMLGIGEDKVVVRTYAGPGHFGRSNGGNAGSEDEAVLLSRALGVPVRVQWMRADDMQWSTQSPTAFAEISIGLDEAGRIATYQATHSSPPMQDDRPIGAILAGLPVMATPSPTNPSFVGNAANGIADTWAYGKIANVAETGRGAYQIGQRESPIAVGLRDHSMRTPSQFQQNFPREMAITEAALLAGADPLQFRIDHTDDPRFIAILEHLRAESDWANRPARTPGAKVLHGQGVSMMLREGGDWACAAHITVTPETGAVSIARMTLVVDPGIIVNPLQLRRQAQAGCLMGVSQALHEEVSFDEGAITSTDWFGYPILSMAEAPEVKVVLAPMAGATTIGQGSESANALASPAIAGAFLDATGKPARRIPLRPEYVKAMLAS